MEINYKPVVFLGAGAFAEMMIKRLLQNRHLDKNSVIATVRRPERAQELIQKYGIGVELDNKKAAYNGGSIILCVRPGDIEVVAKDLKKVSFKDKHLVSVMAGVRLDRITKLFECDSLARVNPNPQIQIGLGYSAISFLSTVTPSARQWTLDMFESLGEIVQVDEPALDAFSALSGIAHVLYFYDCLVDAGIYLGLSEKIAHKTVFKSIVGAMELLKQDKQTPIELLRKATTPGGVGVEKLFVMKKKAFRATIIEAMCAARDKSVTQGCP